MLRLIVMSGPQDGQEVRGAGQEATIGRSPDCDLLLPHDPEIAAEGAVARYHAEILCIQHGAARREVAPGELFRLGRTWLRVTVESAAGT